MWTTFAHSLLFLVSNLSELRTISQDVTLVEMVQKGNMEAYQVLVERHQLWLRRALYHLVSNEEDAEELAQSVFFKAFHGIKHFRSDASFKTWLRQIGTRSAYDFYRHRARGKRAGTHVSLDDVDVNTTRASSPQPGAILEAIQEALDKMPYPYKEILVLRYLEELEMSEIEQLLDLGQGAARMRLTRAREHFRTHYGEISLDGM